MTAEKMMELTERMQAFVTSESKNWVNCGTGALERVEVSPAGKLVQEALDALRSSAVGAGAREALETFAKAAEMYAWPCYEASNVELAVGITVGDLRKARAAFRSLQSEPVQPVPGMQRDWVNCPICDEPDMRKETDAEGASLIHCVNHGCPSNGVPRQSGQSAGDCVPVGYIVRNRDNGKIAGQHIVDRRSEADDWAKTFRAGWELQPVYLSAGAFTIASPDVVRPEAPAGVREKVNAWFNRLPCDSIGKTHFDELMQIVSALPSDPVRRTTQEDGEK